ncbi:MAG: alpha/beta hydrolase [Rubrivivax sp.]|nr:alpha/beta hydrolase [Rubrivivax sp.]
MSSWIIRIVGILMMLTALALAMSRAPDRPVETLVARWAPPPSDFIEVKGQLVHLRDEGPRDDSTPIVLLHGTSASLHTWEGWAHVLKTERRVITLDLPGFGLTGPFAGQYAADDYHGDTYARFIVDVLDTLKLQRVVLGGNSLGGEIAWRLATLAPARVGRLILVDAAGPAFTPESVPIGFIFARLPGLRWISEYVLPRELVAQSVANVYGDPSRLSSAVVDRYFELALREGNRRALGLRLQQMDMGADAGRIAGVTQPTLILWGGRDRLIPPSVARVFEQQIKGSRLVVLPGLGHMPQEEDPVRSLQPVQAFIGWK